MRIFVILILLSFTTLANADLIIKGGKKVVYTGNALQSGITITESETAPVNPQVNDVWRCITDGVIYVWNGTAWVVKNTTQNIKDEIAIFKTNISNVSDLATKKCLTSLGKIILNLYHETP